MPHYGSRPLIKRSFGRIAFEGAYDAGWVMCIKELIPPRDRAFSRDNSIWSFDSRWYGAVKTVTEHFFGSSYIDSTGGVAEPQMNSWKEKWESIKATDFKRAEREKDKSPPKAYSNRVDEAYATLYVTTAAPTEVVTASFRVLSKLHHPDNGGDTEVMARINAAYQELKRHGRVK